MNENTNKKAVSLAQMIAAHKKSDAKVEALKKQVEDLVTAGGEPNVITSIKNNGTALPVTGKGVDIGPSIAEAVAAADHLTRKIVTGVDAIDPAADGAEKYIYMVPKTDAEDNDQYDEYMVLNGSVEHVGHTIEFASDEEVAAALAEIYGADEE